MRTERASERPHRHPLHETAFWLALALPVGCAAPDLGDGSAPPPAGAAVRASGSADAEAQLEGAAAPSETIDLGRRRRCPGSNPLPELERELLMPPGPDLAQPTEAAAKSLATGIAVDDERLLAPPPRRCSPR